MRNNVLNAAHAPVNNHRNNSTGTVAKMHTGMKARMLYP
jgi:hypothetical protein